MTILDWTHIEEDPFLPVLAIPCTCGHDLGDHQADAPHACEGEAGATPCSCVVFQPLRSSARSA